MPGKSNDAVLVDSYSLFNHLFCEEDEAGKVDGKLRENCGDCVDVEDVRERPLLAQAGQRLRPGDEQEAACEQQALEGRLPVRELHPLEVEHTLAVGQD